MLKVIVKFLRSTFDYFLILLGLGIVSWIIWVRFIRMRLPKDLPFFNLTEIGFYILLYICCIYLYIIISLLISRETNPLITKFIKGLYTPLTTLDEAVKYNKYISKKYNKLLDKTIDRFDNLTFMQLVMICYTYQVLPRLLLITILIFDVFYMQKLELIYSFILLGIFPLLHRYIKYSLKYAKEQYIKTLNDTYEFIAVLDKNYATVAWEYNPETMLYHDTEVTVEEYVKIQVESLLGKNKILYEGDPFAKEEVYLEYKIKKYGTTDIKLTSEDYSVIEKEFQDIMPKLIKLSVFLELYSLMNSVPKIKYSKVFIYGIYFISWAYILIISYPKVEMFTLTNSVLLWLSEYIEKIEPFSGTLL